MVLFVVGDRKLFGVNISNCVLVWVLSESGI